MQVRRRLRGGPRAANVSEQLSAFRRLALGEAGRVAIEVRVVIREGLRGVELIDREPTCLAREQFRDGAIVYGMDLRAPRRHDVDRVVPAPNRAGVVERVRQTICAYAFDGDEQITPGEGANGVGHRRGWSFDRRRARPPR